MAYVTCTTCLNSRERNRLRNDEKLDYEIGSLISQNSAHSRLGKRENGEGSSKDSSVSKRLKTEEPDCSVLDVKPRVAPVQTALGSCVASARTGSGSSLVVSVTPESGRVVTGPICKSPARTIRDRAKLVRAVAQNTIGVDDVLKARIVWSKFEMVKSKLAQKKASGPGIKPLTFEEFLTQNKGNGLSEDRSGPSSSPG